MNLKIFLTEILVSNVKILFYFFREKCTIQNIVTFPSSQHLQPLKPAPLQSLNVTYIIIQYNSRDHPLADI